VTVNPGFEFVDFIGSWKSKLMIMESYVAKCQAVKWLALDWIMDFESFKGSIFSVAVRSRKALSYIHPPVNGTDLYPI
jgi:hypothetical protein